MGVVSLDSVISGVDEQPLPSTLKCLKTASETATSKVLNERQEKVLCSWVRMVGAATKERTRRRHPLKKSRKFSDFLTPSPLSAFGTDLYIRQLLAS